MASITHHRNKKTGAVYVYSVESYWDKEKKAPRNRQTCLGRLDPETGEVIPSKRKRKVAERAAAAPGVTVSSRVAGPSLVLDVLTRSCGIGKLLKKCFPADHELILSLVHYIVHKGGALSGAESWSASCLHPFGDVIASQRVSELLRRLSADPREHFLSLWLEHVQEDDWLCYEITSVSSYSRHNEYTHFGYNRDGESLEQVNLAMLFGQNSGLPAHYRRLPGNISDVSTLRTTVKSLDFLGAERLHFVLDRGFYSNANIRDLLLRGHHFTIGVLLGCKQSKDLLAKYRASLNSPKRSVFHEGRCLGHARDVWAVKMGRDERGKKRENRTVEAHIFLDPRRHADCAANLDERVFVLGDKAAKETFTDVGQARAWLKENARRLASCLGIGNDADGAVVVRRRPRAIAARTVNAGYQIVLCDTEARDGVQVLSDYRSRDRAEEVFDMLKNEDGQRRLRTGRQTVAEGRVFLAFVTLVLRAELENRMRAGGILKKITVPEFLAQMGTIRAIRLPDGERLLREVTKKQREWIAAIGVPPPEV